MKNDNIFEMLIVNFFAEQIRTTAGLELVALSRHDSIHSLAIRNNTSDLSHMVIMKNGTVASYTKRKLSLNHLQQMAPQTQQQSRDLIAQMCTLSTYEGGGV